MVSLVLGIAGSGKTKFIMEEMKKAGQQGGKSVLIVPEQYSHDAERQLCAICGPGASLYAEVISFSRLCSRVFSETGTEKPEMSRGGRVLNMELAMEAAAPKTRVYGRGRRTDFLLGMLAAYDELKTACVSPEELERTADNMSGALADKLRDISLITAAYDALLPEGMADPAERLSRLAEAMENSSFGVGKTVYIDGFTDFTAQQEAVIASMVKKGTDITVCLTCDGLNATEPVFSLSRKSAARILNIAGRYGAGTEIINKIDGGRRKAAALEYLNGHLFSADREPFDGASDEIEVYNCKTLQEECRLAADTALRLVREEGYRYRDIAVVARGWEKFGLLVENTFEKYGIPVYSAKKSDILQKPVISYIMSALEVISGDWSYESVFRYLKTGFAGISPEDRDVLENYVLKWSIKGGRMWCREDGWSFNPQGYVQEKSERDVEILSKVNLLRREAARPLRELQTAFASAYTAGEKVRALYDFLADAAIPEKLEKMATEYSRSGQEQLAEEYVQLWDVLTGAMEQFYMIMGGTRVSDERFTELFRLALSQYQLGTIPVALDRVGIGDMTRMRKRNIRCLIVIGASDDSIPSVSRGTGVLSDEERDRLAELGLRLPDGTESRLIRELNAVYSSVTLPSDRLVVSCSCGEGGVRPSFLINRIGELFGKEPAEPGDGIMLSAARPCFELAASGAEGGGVLAAAAAEYIAEDDEESIRLNKILQLSKNRRGALTDETAEKLFHRDINITASRVDRFYACKYGYFLQYGLKAKARKTAGFDAPEAGTFTHFVLENVVSDVMKEGGFGGISAGRLDGLTEKHIKEYINSGLDGFKDKSGRFVYLFRRLAGDVKRIVSDMAEELKNSDFRPLDFELDFSRGGDMPPERLSDGKVSVTVGGKVDRVDGWVRDGRLYLRVVDYKTGKKSFSLSDVWYGLGMQMLIYLFVLQKHGGERYGKEVVPAGVLYMPARDITVSGTRRTTDEEIEKARAKELRRSGLILKDGDVIQAMEHGSSPRYIPVKFEEGAPSGESLARLEDMGKLSRHIDRVLLNMGREMSRGDIAATPYFRTPQDNACVWCEYAGICHFGADGKNDRLRYLKKLKTDDAWEKISGGEDRNG